MKAYIKTTPVVEGGESSHRNNSAQSSHNRFFNPNPPNSHITTDRPWPERERERFGMEKI